MFVEVVADWTVVELATTPGDALVVEPVDDVAVDGCALDAAGAVVVLRPVASTDVVVVGLCVVVVVLAVEMAVVVVVEVVVLVVVVVVVVVGFS